MRIAAIAFAVLPSSSPRRRPAARCPTQSRQWLGPSVGYLLAQSDLCEWGLTTKIEEAYQHGFKIIGRIAEQQSNAWSQAAARRKALTNLSAEAKTHEGRDLHTTTAQ